MVQKSKTCCHCKETKSVSEFWKDSGHKDGLHHNCKECGRSFCQKSHRKKAAAVGRQVLERPRLVDEQKEKTYYERNREAVKKRTADYRRRRLVLQPDYRAVESRRAFARSIGISPDVVEEHYKRLFMKQQAACAVCGRVTEKLCIDHNHKKQGKDSLRGLLCGACNVGISWFNDNKDFCLNASTYLSDYN